MGEAGAGGNWKPGSGGGWGLPPEQGQPEGALFKPLRSTDGEVIQVTTRSCMIDKLNFTGARQFTATTFEDRELQTAGVVPTFGCEPKLGMQAESG